MEMIAMKPERKAELQDYAQRHDQDEISALDSVLADFFAWEKQEYQEASEGIREGIEDMEAGRVMSAKEAFERLRVEHGLPR
jgi:predicted transcriptional regulator